MRSNRIRYCTTRDEGVFYSERGKKCRHCAAVSCCPDAAVLLCAVLLCVLVCAFTGVCCRMQLLSKKFTRGQLEAGVGSPDRSRCPFGRCSASVGYRPLDPFVLWSNSYF